MKCYIKYMPCTRCSEEIPIEISLTIYVKLLNSFYSISLILRRHAVLSTINDVLCLWWYFLNTFIIKVCRHCHGRNRAFGTSLNLNI